MFKGLYFFDMYIFIALFTTITTKNVGRKCLAK